MGKHKPAFMHVSMMHTHTILLQSLSSKEHVTKQKNTRTPMTKKNVAVTTFLNLSALQPDRSESECFYFLSTGCRLGDGQEMDFSSGSVQM